MPDDLRDQLKGHQTKLLSKFKDKNNLEGLIVGVPQEFFVDSLSSEVTDVWRRGIQRMKDLGASVVSVSIPHVPLALPTYYIIALAEASSNLSRYDGVRYGKVLGQKKEKKEIEFFNIKCNLKDIGVPIL